jgi:hypothetical protein
MADIATRESLALKIYAETLTAFERKNVFMELVTKQTINGGKSAQFIVDTRGVEANVAGIVAGTAGTVGANALNSGVVRTHNLGVDSRTLASDILVGERTITVERPKVIRKNIDDFDAQIVPYNTRTIATGQMGRSMASYVDQRVIYELDKAMVATALVDSNNGSIEVQDTATNIFNADIKTGGTAGTREAKGDALVETLFYGVGELDGKDQTGYERVFVTNNENYYNLLLSQKAVNRDFNAGDNGSIADGNVFRIGDVMILRSNSLYAGLLTNTLAQVGGGDEFVGFMLSKNVIGMLELKGLQTKQWMDDDYDQYIMKATLTAGYGILNPASLVAITTGSENS